MGPVVGALVGDLVGALVGPLVGPLMGQGSLSPALCVAHFTVVLKPFHLGCIEPFRRPKGGFDGIFWGSIEPLGGFDGTFLRRSNRTFLGRSPISGYLGSGRSTVGKCTGPKWSKMVQTTIVVK